MSAEDMMFLYDEAEQTNTRFVSFIGQSKRFDLAIISTHRFYGKLLILDLQSNRFAIIGTDDLEEPGYLEQIYQLSEEEADELRQFVYTLL